LEVPDITIFNMTTHLRNLEPLRIANGFAGGPNGIANGIVNGCSRGSDDLGLAVDMITHDTSCFNSVSACRTPDPINGDARPCVAQPAPDKG
jgi:hypothetical protein